jgi:GH15 family glucan-1,4-alpha-glucosidase
MTSYNNKKKSLASNSDNNQHRYNLGLIGNCSYNALIDDKANIKWLCWPRFDSSFIFGSLLDEKLGGNYSVESEGENVTTKQHYLQNTNILVTTFESELGVFEVIDFAPRFFLNERYHKPNMFFRKIKKVSGFPRIKIKCNPVGNYGKTIPERTFGSNHIRFSGLEQPVRLTTNASLNFILQEQNFTLTEEIYLVLSWGIPIEGPLVSTFEDFFLRTKKYWQGWVERCTLPKIFQAEVIRSALTLKLHQYEDTGGIIASVTTSLPEIPNQGRNWDYRYAWLRDSYYTITAFNSLGHFSELEKYAHFIESINPSKLSRLHPVYCVDGSSEMPEIELELEGYLNNKPVRVGNQAGEQIQNDAYGQVILALFHLYTDARILDKDRLSVKTLSNLLESIENTLEEPDNGIWEFRGKQSVHSYTLLFHWAGSAACVKIAESLQDEVLAERAKKIVNRAADLLTMCYSKNKKAFTQSIGSEELDASLIQIIILGFLEDQPKEIALLHLKAIQKELEIKHGFLLRYNHADDFGAQKSAFLICSFWLVEALAYLDQIDEAKELFEVLLCTQNHLGLISESYDVETKSQWGNFPQAYSHVGLINSVFALDKAIKKPKFRV